MADHACTECGRPEYEGVCDADLAFCETCKTRTWHHLVVKSDHSVLECANCGAVSHLAVGED